MTQEKVSVCFVCMGNICRSPTAEGIFIQLVEQAGLRDRFMIDSAGTSAHHEGERADPRSREYAESRGVDLPSVSRLFRAYDFERFDYVIAMDSRNHNDMARLASVTQRPKLHMMRSFDATALTKGAGSLDVPDPYYGSGDGFARVFDICMAGCIGLLAHIRANELR
jgi:protein-tyrosine phosphatase